MPNRFEPNDAEEILKRAIAIDTVNTHSKESLLKTAEELGISREAVEQAERDFYMHKREQDEMSEFIRHQRRSFWSHLSSYVIVNLFLFFVDVSTGGPEWFWWPLFGWGIGIAFHAVGVFNTHSEDFQEEFEAWRAKRRTSNPGSSGQ